MAGSSGGSGDPIGPTGPGDSGGGSPNDGDVVIINGREYVWSPSIGWLLSTGKINLDTPTYYALDPFWNAEPAEWGKPFKIWGSGAANTPGLAQHVQQQQLIEVLLFADINNQWEIPLIDANNNPLLDPAIPPLYGVRRSSSITYPEPDRVNNITAPTWDDTNCCIKPYPGNHVNSSHNENESPAISCVFRIEKTPVPHWVIRLSYTWNQLTTGGGATALTSFPTTILVQAIGWGSNTASQTIEVGSFGVEGHYRVTKVFWPDQAPASVGSVTRFDQPVYAHDEDYIASGLASSAIYLTSDGTAGGTAIFDSNYIPFVRFFGDRWFQQDRGTTETDYKATSLGVGYANDGIWAHHEDSAGNPRSIQHPSFDEYMMISQLDYASSRWRVGVYSFMNTANAAGITIAAGTPTTAWSRHASIHSYGRGA